MKILIISTALSGGGAERSMNVLASYFHQKQHKVQVLVINDSNPDLFELECRVTELRRKSGYINLIKSIIQFIKTVRSDKPDVVLVNCDISEFFALFLLTRAKIFVIQHIDKPFHTRKFLGLIIRLLLIIRGAKIVRVAKFFPPWPFKRSFSPVIPNAIAALGSSNGWSNELKCEEIPPGPISKLVYIGRLNLEQKRPDIFCNIAQQVKMPVIVYGEGSYKFEMESFFKSNEIEYEFKDFVQNCWAEISPYDLIVVPSAFEGDGLVAVEAIILGRPILLSNIDAFIRFELEEKHYCSSTSQYVNKILLHKNNVSYFKPSKERMKELLFERNVEVVASKWLKLFSD